MTHTIIKTIIAEIRNHIVGYIISAVFIFVVSNLFIYYIVVTSHIWLFVFLCILLFSAVYLVLSYFLINLRNKYFHNLYIRFFASGSITLFFIFLLNFFLVVDKIDYAKTDIDLLQNIPRNNVSAIIKNNWTFFLDKRPQVNHPYMGVLSFGKFQNDKRFLIEMEGVLEGEGQLWIVLLKDGKMPTEYIELLASTTADNIALNNVDGKNKNNIEKESVKIYESKKFKLFMDYRKYDNEACIYYNSVYSELFNKKCINLPKNVNLKFVGFKMVDDNIENNNLKVPEISKFIVYSLRF